MKKQIFIIDTSAILSGKPINLGDSQMITTPSIANELKPGGRDYRNFQFLLEKGLSIISPTKKSIEKIKLISHETGDKQRLSSADIELLALAIDINNDEKYESIILSDDYSIQNVAKSLNLKYKSFSQKGIVKKFKWKYRCPGCNKQFKTPIKICPICGTKINISDDQKK